MFVQDSISQQLLFIFPLFFNVFQTLKIHFFTSFFINFHHLSSFQLSQLDLQFSFIFLDHLFHRYIHLVIIAPFHHSSTLIHPSLSIHHFIHHPSLSASHRLVKLYHPYLGFFNKLYSLHFYFLHIQNFILTKLKQTENHKITKHKKNCFSFFIINCI